MAFNSTIHSYSPLCSYEPGRTPWCLGCRRLRSDPTWDDPQRCGLQTLENKALSRGIIGELAPTLAEITIWESQYLPRMIKPLTLEDLRAYFVPIAEDF